MLLDCPFSKQKEKARSYIKFFIADRANTNSFCFHRDNRIRVYPGLNYFSNMFRGATTSIRDDGSWCSFCICLFGRAKFALLQVLYQMASSKREWSKDWRSSKISRTCQEKTTVRATIFKIPDLCIFNVLNGCDIRSCCAYCESLWTKFCNLPTEWCGLGFLQLLDDWSILWTSHIYNFANDSSLSSCVYDSS